MLATSTPGLSPADAQKQFNATLPSLTRAIRCHAGRMPKRRRDEFLADVLARPGWCRSTR